MGERRGQNQALYRYIKVIQFLGPTPRYLFTTTRSPVRGHLLGVLNPALKPPALKKSNIDLR